MDLFQIFIIPSLDQGLHVNQFLVLHSSILSTTVLSLFFSYVLHNLWFSMDLFFKVTPKIYIGPLVLTLNHFLHSLDTFVSTRWMTSFFISVLYTSLFSTDLQIHTKYLLNQGLAFNPLSSLICYVWGHPRDNSVFVLCSIYTSEFSKDIWLWLWSRYWMQALRNKGETWPMQPMWCW